MSVTETVKPRSMTSVLGNHVLRNGLSRLPHNDHPSNRQPMKLLPGPSGNADRCLTVKHSRVESMLSSMNKLVKGKLSLGAKILQVGGVVKVFRQMFTVREDELLLRASRCCLSTTAGPVSGRLFISTKKVAFCSDRPIATVSSPSGESLRFHYKIVIPLAKIKQTILSENMKKPAQKYVHVVTTDEFEFWFMGFLHYKKTFKCLLQAVPQTYG